MAGADLKILGELTNPVNLKITKPPSKGPNVWTWGALIVGMLAFIIPLILVWKFAEAMVISTDPATGDLVMRTRIAFKTPMYFVNNHVFMGSIAIRNYL